MDEKPIWCPDGCYPEGQPETAPTGRLIESTEPDASGEYKDVCTCDECGLIFYVVRTR